MKHVTTPFSAKSGGLIGRLFGGALGAGKPARTVFSEDALCKLGLPLVTGPDELVLSTGLVDRGRTLVRQDRLDDLAQAITRHDHAQDTTRGGTPIAELLAAGARSDLSRALYGASEVGALAPKSRVFTGLDILNEAITDHGDDPVCAAIMALTHMDAGWAWYRQGWQRGKPETYLPQFQSAFSRAEALLAPFEKTAGRKSAFLASTRCALLAGLPEAEERAITDFERLINLAPRMPGHMRSFGLHLLPCWFGSYGQLELEARRTAARTGALWGDGGYAWIYLDAAVQDAACFAFLDIEFFLSGIDHILDRMPNQHVANLLAAYLSQMLSTPQGTGPDRTQRRALSESRTRILREHMQETHPWVWAMMDFGYATPGHAHLSGEDGIETGIRQVWDAVSIVFAQELHQKSA